MVAESQALIMEKLCALTFDDGPDTEKSSKVLDRLETYGIPASFLSSATLLATKAVLFCSVPALFRVRSKITAGVTIPWIQ